LHGFVLKNQLPNTADFPLKLRLEMQKKESINSIKNIMFYENK